MALLAAGAYQHSLVSLPDTHSAAVTRPSPLRPPVSMHAFLFYTLLLDLGSTPIQYNCVSILPLITSAKSMLHIRSHSVDPKDMNFFKKICSFILKGLYSSMKERSQQGGERRQMPSSHGSFSVEIACGRGGCSWCGRH